MTRTTLSLLLVAFLTCALPPSGQALEVPYLAGRVNDAAGMLSGQTVAELEALLAAHEDSTSNQVVVLTVPSLEGEPLEDFSIRVAETWKIGQADKDNGAILLIARDDRMVRIEVGSGLEGDLPDITCGRIIRNEIVPRFRDGDIDGGVRAGVHAMLAAIAGAYTAEDSAEAESGAPAFFFLVFLLVIGLFTASAVFNTGIGSWFLFFFLMPFWFAFSSIGLGVGAGLAILVLYAVVAGIAKLWLGLTGRGRKMRKRYSSMWGGGSWAGGWVGSSFSGGGGGFSGGFSGGGGGFSGGGASGRW